MDSSTGLVTQSEFYQHLRQQTPTSDRLVVDSKDVEETLEKAARILSATYRHPYQMHGSVGSSCAVADVREGKVTLWSATQAVHPLKQTASSF